MWRRKYASNIYAGLLKSLREVQFDRRDIQPPILNQVEDLDEEDMVEEEPPSNLTTDTSGEPNERIVPFLNLRRSARIAEQTSTQ